jgi:hypothetical protein
MFADPLAKPWIIVHPRSAKLTAHPHFSSFARDLRHTARAAL